MDKSKDVAMLARLRSGDFMNCVNPRSPFWGANERRIKSECRKAFEEATGVKHLSKECLDFLWIRAIDKHYETSGFIGVWNYYKEMAVGMVVAFANGTTYRPE